MQSFLSRRHFLAASALFAGTGLKVAHAVPDVVGFDETQTNIDGSQAWKRYSDRKLRVALVGFGFCQFSVQFGFQNHPNVEIVAVSDLDPARCDALSKAVQCEKKYPSLEELLKDDSVEAVFLATDAPSHARQAIQCLKAGKHVASAVPAFMGNVDDAYALYEAVRAYPELVYSMFETTAYRDSCFATRQLYRAGALGKLIYTEGEYYHYGVESLPSWNHWRDGLPPQYYPTHSNGFYVCVTGGSFTEVCCMGMPSILNAYKPDQNPWKNPFGTEHATFRTSEGGSARMIVSWDSLGIGGEMGRCRGQLGGFYDQYTGNAQGNEIAQKTNIRKPALPEGVPAGGHGGSHGYLMTDFVDAILLKRQPLVDVRMALNLTMPGYIAHQSALKDGELMKIPQFN